MELTAIFQLLSQGVVGLTPNLRLSHYWNQAYAEYQRTQTETSIWKAPAILPVQSWYRQLWLDLSKAHPLPTLLTDAQEAWLWTSILEEDATEYPLINPIATAASLQQAWSLIQAWKLPWDDRDFAQTPDQHCMQRWGQAFIQRSKALNLLEPARLLTRLSENLENLPRAPVLFLHLSELPPNEQAFWERWQAAGGQSTTYHPDKLISQNETRIFQNQEDEYQAMIDWACSRRAQGAKRIACVISDLQEQKPRLERLFDKRVQGQYPINISLGNPLLDYPLITTALQILLFDQASIPMDELSTLVRSPFLGGAQEELGARSRLDAELWALGLAEIPKQTLINLAKTMTPELSDRLMKITTPNSQKRSPQEWVLYFGTMLTDLGWPGDRVLSSDEYQQAERFQALLAEAMQIERLSPRITWSETKALLKRLSAQTLFQSQSIPGTVIQVMGVLEALNLPFDAIWVTSLDDRHWPSGPKPNPFIPYEWQRRCQLPHSTPEREFLFSQTVLMEFQRQTPQLILSVAKQIDESEARISQLIRDFPSQEFESRDLISEQKPYALEVISDPQGPPVSESHILGGSYVLREQAACPFRAFARSRLRAEPLGSPILGLSALERGTVLHGVLENFWRRIQDSATLKQLSREDEETLILHAIRQTTRSLPSSLQDLESQRLLPLIQQWLAIEKEREDFKVIGTELSAELSLAGKQLTLRMDRVDELADGSQIVIDYKTGFTSTHDWFGSRPQEPQLPLYTLTNTEIKGIAYAQIRADKMQFHGVAAETYTHLMPIEWNEQKALWQQQLTLLMQEYLSGIATVTPHEASTCQYCECLSLCRLSEDLS